MKKKIKYLIKHNKERFIRYIKKIYNILMMPQMGILPGQLAFFMLLAFVPIFTLIGYILTLFGIDSAKVIEALSTVVPGGASALTPLFSGTSMDLKLVLICVWMFYIASNGFNSIILASNQIYGTQNSTWIRRRIKAMFMTLVFILMLLIILLVPVFGGKILDLLNLGDTKDKVYLIYKYVKGPIMWLFMFIFIRTTYEFAPDRMRNKTHINTGAIFTSIGWIIVTLIYSYMANNMSNFNIIYGTLANIAFLMMWLYFMSLIFVMGMSLNYGEEIDKEIKEKTGAIKVIRNK